MDKKRRDFLKYTGIASSIAMFSPNIAKAYEATNGVSVAQKDIISYMWHYEKLRKDVFWELSKRFDTLQKIKNFALYSSTNRFHLLTELINLYDVDISHLNGSYLLYTKEQIKAQPLGVFASSEFSKLYTELLSDATDVKNSLFVAVKLSVSTVDKIDGFLGELSSNQKLYNAFSYLKDGAVRDYWVLDQELKQGGVTKGCCELGESWCKTLKEYPNGYTTDDDKPTSLSDDQKYSLAFMWSEEKMAHDAYEMAYSVYPELRIFHNIGRWSEGQHLASVEELIALYDIDINNLGNKDGYYDKEALRKMDFGDYAFDSFETTYPILISMATTSKVDALKVGCMVEVKDIRDLTQFLEKSNQNKYIESTFQHLIEGSQSHYWAFDHALKRLGISDGCCCAGEEYCKSPKEFPFGSGDETLAMLWNKYSLKMV